MSSFEEFRNKYQPARMELIGFGAHAGTCRSRELPAPRHC
jgi:hypothetical protein